MSQPSFQSLGEFYTFYLQEHSNPINRLLHFLGTLASLAVVVLAIAKGRPLLLLLSPIIGYALAWVGHFGFERNQPATFEFPVYSLFSDFRMFYEIMIGREKFTPKRSN